VQHPTEQKCGLTRQRITLIARVDTGRVDGRADVIADELAACGLELPGHLDLGNKVRVGEQAVPSGASRATAMERACGYRTWEYGRGHSRHSAKDTRHARV